MGLYESLKDVAKAVQKADNIDLYIKLINFGSLRNRKSIAQESILRQSVARMWYMMWWTATKLCWKR